MSGDIFLKLDGIQGESKDKAHTNEIQIETASWDASNPTSFGYGDGGGVGKTQLSDITLTKKVDESSQKLLKACWTGDHIKSGVLTFRKAGKEQQEFLKVTLKEVMVSSVSFHDEAGGDLPQEIVRLAFSKFEIEYRAQKPDGGLKAGSPVSWDIKQNEAA